MEEDREERVGERSYGPDAEDERRRFERRAGVDRRGPLRWDPRALEKERRSGTERRRFNEAVYTRQ